MSKLLTNHDLSITTKLRLTRCYVWSALLYASETWSLTPTMEKRLRAFEMWAYRRLCRISWTERKTNTEILERLKLKGPLSTVRTRKAKCFGHIRRHQCIQKKIFEGKVDRKRGRGRRRTNWLSGVATTVNQPINTCGEMALDRAL